MPDMSVQKLFVYVKSSYTVCQYLCLFFKIHGVYVFVCACAWEDRLLVF